jgi:hypothetical protein
MAMETRRVLLLCVPSLLSEGLENILRRVKDVQLVGPWPLDAHVLDRVPEGRPDIVLIAEDDTVGEGGPSFTTQVLDQYPDLPVVRIGWVKHEVRLYTSHALPARSANLIEAIHNLPVRQPTQQEG